MVSFIDQHRAEYGVEPICAQAPIAPSSYYERKAREGEPEREPPRVRRDVEISHEIQRIWDENFQVYGARKIWRQLCREGVAVARCSVERLMRSIELRGAVRGGKRRTTISRDQTDYPADLVTRQFAFRDRNLNHAIRIVHERTREFLMTERRSMLAAFFLRLDGFLIARRRLRRVARISGVVQPLLETLIFSFQVGDALAQRLEFGKQLLEQWAKLLAR